MSLQAVTSIVSRPLPSTGMLPIDETLRIENLPFSIRVVQTDEDLAKAVQIRHQAYARHMPEVARTLITPESVDFDATSVILVAESKADGSPIGTIRLQTNDDAPLKLESSVELPAHVRGRKLAHVSRLAVAQGGAGRVVKTALIKASFMVCDSLGVDWAIVAARSPLDRQYEALMFVDLLGEGAFVPLAHMNNVPHRVMGFEIATGRRRWEAARHPLFGFFCETRHPDIHVEEPLRDTNRSPAIAYLATPKAGKLAPVL